MTLKGLFTLSDDAHSVAQVATNYSSLIDFVQKVPLESIVCLDQAISVVHQPATVKFRHCTVEEVMKHPAVALGSS